MLVCILLHYLRIVFLLPFEMQRRKRVFIILLFFFFGIQLFSSLNLNSREYFLFTKVFLDFFPSDNSGDLVLVSLIKISHFFQEAIFFNFPSRNTH